MEEYNWPGNIRELKNLIERLIILTRADEIGIKDVRDNVPHPYEIAATDRELFSFDEHKGLRSAKESFERTFIGRMLKKNEYNITKTAQII